MPPAMPLAELVDQYRRARPRVDLKVLSAQLGLLPNLAYLRDGLLRTRESIAAYHTEMSHCLRAVPGPRLEPAALIAEIGHLLNWIDRQSWPVDDDRLSLMARPSVEDDHPLAGYCLTVCFHWPNLFYSLEPDGTDARGNGGWLSYERLMAEFSTYILSAQATVDADGYFEFCEDWWRAGKQPAQAPFPSRRLASRVAGASINMRRLSLIEYRPLFTQLSDLSAGRSFHERVSLALTNTWSEHEQKALDAIARLLEDIVPGWRRLGVVGSSGGKGSSSPRERQQNYRDGYIRISDSQCISTEFESDSGLVFQATAVRPLEIEEVEKQVRQELKEVALADDRKSKKTAKERKDEEERLIKAARAEAEAAMDGVEWFPVDNAISEDQIEAAVLPITEDVEAVIPAVPGVSPGGSSRWAADQLKRYHMANGLAPGRMTLDQAQTVLAAMSTEDPTTPLARLLPCLHASIALGRPLKEAAKLEVHKSLPQESLNPKAIHYVIDIRKWIVFMPPPAWHDKDPSVHERIQQQEIRLSDQTDFRQLLTHLDIVAKGQPVAQLRQVNKEWLEDWLKKILPRSDCTLASCGRFLFYRLLDISNGDVGVASLITSQTHSHSGSVVHYSHYAKSALGTTYRAAWVPKVTKKDFAVDPRHASKDTVVEGFGARRVPTLKAVRDLIAWLQKRIGETSGNEQHNLYTAYTWVGLVLGIALRPVREPHIFKMGREVADFLIVTYLDKARSDYHRRVNSIPEIVAKHLDYYARYLRTLDRLHFLDPAYDRPIFRYQEDDSSIRAFRPSDFCRLVKPVFDLELYSLRRFSRTHLMADPKLGGEDVDAAHGHWFDRVSPHDRLSAYPMMRLHGIAMNAATRMVEATGFLPLRVRP